MAIPIKILEVKGTDWLKGLSIQASYPYGGLFQSAKFDPFEKIGYAKPPLSSVILDASTITTQINHLVSKDNGNGFVWGIGDRSATGAKCLYAIDLSDSSVLEYTAEIDTNAATGALTHNGLTIYKSRLIYEQGGSLRSNTLVPASGNDTNILTSAETSGTTSTIRFVIGSDANLYYTANSGFSIGQITSTTGTAGNSSSIYELGSGMIPRDLTFDGRYLICVSDDNDNKGTDSVSNCQVRFYDLDNTSNVLPILTWTIPDSFLIGGRYVDGKIVILGASGIWVCNIETPPKLAFPLNSARLPSNASQITAKNDILYWVTTGAGSKIYAYGSTVGDPILFSPYDCSSSGTALANAGTYFVATSDTPDAYLLNSGSTRASTIISTASIPLSQSYQLSYVKIVLDAPLSSGQEMNLKLFNGGGQVIMDTNAKTFTTNGAKQTLIYQPKSSAGAFKTFEDIYFYINSVGGATIQRVAVYGIPLEDNSQII